ncbi:tyrosine-type recombinase/integrase [Clostridium ljungdahlii]|uniref:Tyrosine recombinase XerC n=1 Tax=Clostridium ljungdahlii TaxID=1538 RepID=A0A168PJ88_9CLOT|nr:tyrosine-type recombinase/integrase [Clostridium ljungdahlii]OAA87813.1 Tyrosine recombinase XerC [Clostridium ljungdahlii]
METIFDLDKFKKYLLKERKSENTIKSYIININEYIKWFNDSYGLEVTKLYRENVLDYKSYLLNIKKFKGRNLNARTINVKLSSLVAINKFLIEEGIQQELVINNKDTIKVQQEYANPCIVEKKDVEAFRQKILEAGEKRLYALATLMSYSGLRITESLSIKLADICLEGKEIIIRKGKGNKQRVVYINTKIVEALKAYVKVRRDDSEFLFVSRESKNLSRSVVNREFKKYSNVITPHMLRHYYCSHALDMGYSVAEVAYQAGHRDTRTTLIYTNPSRKKLKEMAELL